MKSLSLYDEIRIWRGTLKGPNRTPHLILRDQREGGELVEKLSTGPEEAVWFFAMKRGSGRRRTPRGSNLMWPSVTLRARSELRLWPKATATKKTVLTVKR